MIFFLPVLFRMTGCQISLVPALDHGKNNNQINKTKQKFLHEATPKKFINKTSVIRVANVNCHVFRVL